MLTFYNLKIQNLIPDSSVRRNNDYIFLILCYEFPTNCETFWLNFVFGIYSKQILYLSLELIFRAPLLTSLTIVVFFFFHNFSKTQDLICNFVIFAFFFKFTAANIACRSIRLVTTVDVFGIPTRMESSVRFSQTNDRTRYCKNDGLYYMVRADVTREIDFFFFCYSLCRYL